MKIYFEYFEKVGGTFHMRLVVDGDNLPLNVEYRNYLAGLNRVMDLAILFKCDVVNNVSGHRITYEQLHDEPVDDIIRRES